MFRLYQANLGFVLRWPDDGYVTAERCCLEVNYRAFV